ncbi:HlyD family type I secretion periplasmic adaptor subunit [Pseudomonas aegrilactucae]|uniref:Membrane fusion protein (MFP) family protein n=1 Tax=Pseudomonas aegrilactucae TaxID=2854028 RepID=A0A9Q3AEN4_9PSED|nr:HlyD family type I secretion periplasmic adaptor subunit [Pseudomonas aegrilactucae]MBV6287615.1 HlyD family type I secretion periplasmic adaptor subunit [Pseudomonas aegrilactucae]
MNATLQVTDGRERWIGCAIVLLTFGVCGAWAAFAPLDSASLAPGVITVQHSRKTVQHLEGGIVSTLHVRDGDRVKAGDVLITLNDSRTSAEREMLRSQLAAVQAMQARLAAERDGLSALPASDGAGDDERLREARVMEARVFQARRAAREGEAGVLHKRVLQLQAQVRGFETLIAGKRALAASYTEEIADLRELLREGFVDRQRLREQERSLARLRGEIAELQASIAQSRLEASETELRVLQLDTQFARQVADQLAELGPRAFDLRERLAAVDERAQRTLVRAPDAGIVLGLRVHTVGGVITPGMALMDIVPEREALVVEVQISTTDIDRVMPGNPVDIRFSAFSSASTPVMAGRLSRVSADRLVNENTGAAYYLGQVELTEAALDSLAAHRLQLVPGMPAEVLLKVGERTLLSYLTQPAGNLFARALIED